jgi:hypothetical protein
LSTYHSSNIVFFAIEQSVIMSGDARLMSENNIAFEDLVVDQIALSFVANEMVSHVVFGEHNSQRWFVGNKDARQPSNKSFLTRNGLNKLIDCAKNI